ncbi:MAG: hypothetical protein U5K79_21975 [Cyclobacteriaceae bacterium]|nr:hypothetical protein [Cyclobacteriaceae bacterium]
MSDTSNKKGKTFLAPSAWIKPTGKALTFNEADNHKNYWLQKDINQRLKAAWFLIASAYGFHAQTIHRDWISQNLP